MNSEERRILTQFLDQLAGVKGVERDPEADKLIAEAVARQPDAAYLLVQKALLQEQALTGAKARIEALQGQLRQSRGAAPAARGSFLGSDPWAAPTRQAAPPAGNWPGAGPVAPGMPGMGFGGGMGSFLGTAAATAAGIAGGAFLFQGIESLLGHHGSGDGLLGSNDAGHDPIENVTINEYYGSDHDLAEEDGQDLDFQDADFQPEDEGYDDYGDDDSLSV
jgi:hypothetical protein